MTSYALTEEQIRQFDENGYLALPGWFTDTELAPLRELYALDPTFQDATVDYPDSDGKTSRILSWTDLDDSYLGIMPRLRRVVDGMTALLRRPCYHYHSTLVAKGPEEHTRFDWHQDYGDFYKDGCLFPEIISFGVAITDTSVSNGCLRLVPGSHQFGRLEHLAINGSVSADPDRIAHILELFPPVDLELRAGDVVFFDGNTLHSSYGNHTKQPRMMIHIRYCSVRNDPALWRPEQKHHGYRDVESMPDDTLALGRYSQLYNSDIVYAPEKGYGQGESINTRTEKHVNSVAQ